MNPQELSLMYAWEFPRLLHAAALVADFPNFLDLAGQLNQRGVPCNVASNLAQQVHGFEPVDLQIISQKSDHHHGPQLTLSEVKDGCMIGTSIVLSVIGIRIEGDSLVVNLQLTNWTDKTSPCGSSFITDTSVHDIKQQEVDFCTLDQLEDPRFLSYLTAWRDVVGQVLKRSHSADLRMPSDLVFPDVMKLKRARYAHDYIKSLKYHGRMGKWLSLDAVTPWTADTYDPAKPRHRYCHRPLLIDPHHIKRTSDDHGTD
jgi:hypothetical protein